MSAKLYNPEAPMITLDDIKHSYIVLRKCPSDQYHKTPLLQHAQDLFGMKDVQLYLKLENTQVTGSFKVRGLISQLDRLPEGFGTEKNKLITFSAGNYGKAFAHMLQKTGRKGLVIMPNTAPQNRATLIKSYGLDVLLHDPQTIMEGVNKEVEENGMLLMHPFDDTALIAGYASVTLEILEELPDPDIVIINCGGGGTLAGASTAFRLLDHKRCKIYGVEPQGSRTMYESFKAGHAVSMKVGSVAAGLSPPFAGTNTYRHCREYVDDILLVSDEEILKAMMMLYKAGFVVEPSGAAGFAALYFGKVPDAKGKKVVVVISGGNISPEEYVEHSAKVEHITSIE